ncbi:BTB/POZ domain-containing protein FBL11 [Euphorbia peplus]|nr:BTB/POZ domain-containing protein FBL11 [Euphorbia peplus]
MTSFSGEEFVTLSCTDPNPTGNNEILITTKDIYSWDLPSILRCQTVKIQAHRHRLVEDSSFFDALLAGNFSESNFNCVSIEWNLESFVNILKCVYGLPVNVTSKCFLSLFEDALYFGSKSLLSKCSTWFSEVPLTNDPELLELDDLIHIWNFGTEHANDFIPEICEFYLARNFMRAMSSNFFEVLPYNLLIRCIKHPHLTVHSEVDLSDALLVWLYANRNREKLEPSNKVEDHCKAMLKQIRVCLLPLWFVAGKRRCCYFSELADKSTKIIFRLMEFLPLYPIGIFEDGDFLHLRIRLTEYSKKVNLSGCLQVTSVILHLSLLPSEYYADLIRTEISHESLINFEHLNILQIQSEILRGSPPILSFEAVEEVDISKCPRLHLESAVKLFLKSFPSLRKLTAAYLLNFKSRHLLRLMQNCRSISEVDITVDVTPLIASQVSVVSSSLPIVPRVSNNSLFVDNDIFDKGSSFSGPCLSNITRLILEGRRDVFDLDLRCIKEQCVSLQYINLKGCISVTDIGISSLISDCLKLHSIVVCDTSFGIYSVQALCSLTSNIGPSDYECSKRCLSALAFKLQTLHMGGCKGVDEQSLVDLLSKTQTLRRLCLRDTNLVDDALYGFSCSSLEMLDVSQTLISGDALAHIVSVNPALKCLNAKGCKNLSQHGNENTMIAYSHRELFSELGKKCKLEKIALGWGISWLSFEALKPAITSLREIQIGLGGSLGENALRLLPTSCPLLESVVLYFQVISDTIITNIMTLRHLRALGLAYCFGDISISSFKNCSMNLTKLKLERVAPWMTNNDLDVLIHNFESLVEFALVGCRLLNSDSLRIISYGWPGLMSIHLEDCGEVTKTEVSSLFYCRALEDILLRHNGKGINRSFILDAASELPMLRRLSLDACDASEGEFEIPSYSNRGFLSTVKIARCKFQRSSNVYFPESCRSAVHKDSLVVEWECQNSTRTVVKERL